jgi:hypothetical protein
MNAFRTVFALAVAAVVLCVGTGSAQTLPSPDGPHVILYELTENLKVSKGKMPRRMATASLSGFAVAGSPLCPEEIAIDGHCTVNVIGRDNISTRTGVGTLNGDFAVTVQGDNPLDAPEAVALRGTFNGTIDLSPALTGQAPIGTLTGSMVLSGGGRVPIHGVFRLPFLCGGVVAYLGTDEFGLPTGACDPVDPSETLFGRYMVRLDVWF